ncbi:MAG: endonuclease [Francisellaceae bacterium]|nr:endonuclease [Francisellaceae bacterium]
MTPKKVIKFFQLLKQNNPSPKTELIYSTPFELLIAVILSAQSTDKRVNLVTESLFKIANTPQDLLNLGENKLKELTQSIGLYNTKSKNIIKTCEILVNQYNGQVPSNRKDLESLYGVGRKTANVILNTIFNEPTLAVDTHIFRVSNRTGLSKGKNVWEVEQGLLKIIPKDFLQDAHHWLVLHGRYVCIARKPKCGQCVVKDLCNYPFKT